MILLPGLGIPVRTIFAIGRNYAEHARELGNAVPSEPIVFLKPVSALCTSGQSIELPAQSQQVHHEVEVVVAIGASGKNVPEERALGLVAGYAVGIDVTARDLQEKAKQKGQPWSVAKGFDTFAPVSAFVPASRVRDPQMLGLELVVNGKVRQSGSTSEMLFPISRLISHLSTLFTLAPGDLIFTGTPAGVGPLESEDRIEAWLTQLGQGSEPREILAHLDLSVR